MEEHQQDSVKRDTPQQNAAFLASRIKSILDYMSDDETAYIEIYGMFSSMGWTKADLQCVHDALIASIA